MSTPARTDFLQSPIARALLASLLSTLGIVIWKVFDSSIERQLARQLPAEALSGLAVLVAWVVPIAILAPALRLIWGALAPRLSPR
jgi:hypothetical protein